MKKSIGVGALQMPAVGLGLWKTAPSVAAETVMEAVSIGYRHFDSASDYGNELQVGEGLRESFRQGLVKREELWVTSKLWNTFHRPEHVRLACERTLCDLGLSYLDLYLIHFPISLRYVDFDTRYPPEWVYDPGAPVPAMELDPVPLSETWAAMEGLVGLGLVKEIGICNYNSGLLHDLMAYAEIKPAMLQIESHPYLCQERLLKLAKQYDIAVTAFSPLGALSYVEIDMARHEESILDQIAVVSAANRLNRTPAQVVLRWGIQRGTAVIPKTSRRDRLLENLNLFDFELLDSEMADIARLDSGRRFNDPGLFCEQEFGCLHPIYD